MSESYEGLSFPKADMDAATTILQEAPVDGPEIRVIGIINGDKVIKPQWGDSKAVIISERTLATLEKLGVGITDNPDEYLI